MLKQFKAVCIVIALCTYFIGCDEADNNFPSSSINSVYDVHRYVCETRVFLDKACEDEKYDYDVESIESCMSDYSKDYVCALSECKQEYINWMKAYADLYQFLGQMHCDIPVGSKEELEFEEMAYQLEAGDLAKAIDYCSGSKCSK